jgi:YD repeat-containing protein
MTGRRRAGRAGATAWFALVAVALAVGCEPLPITAVAPNARWRPEPVCRLHKQYAGNQSFSDDEYLLAADGRVIEIRSDWKPGCRREVFIRDDQGQLLAREKTGENVGTAQYSVANPGPFRNRITYRYDGKGRRTSAEDVDIGVTDPHAVTLQRRLQYRYDDDRLVAIEWTTGSDPRHQAWRLIYEGARLVQKRYELDGAVKFLDDYQYDPAGRRTVALSVRVAESEPPRYEFRYDPAGKLIGRDVIYHGEPRPEQRVEYDAAGRVTRLIDREFETRYTFDDAGRITRIEHLAAQPVNRSVSEFTYGDGCTAKITAGLIPDPVSNVLDDLWIGSELWFLVHPEWDGEPPWF